MCGMAGSCKRAMDAGEVAAYYCFAFFVDARGRGGGRRRGGVGGKGRVPRNR